MDWTIFLWMILALVIAGVVMTTGLLDLIWLAAAAMVAFAVGWILPEGAASPITLLVVFAVSSAGLILAGRFIRLPKPPDTGLNQRSARMVGEVGTALEDFAAGHGRINVGDIQWAARAADRTNFIARGDSVEVLESDGLTLIVAPISD